MVVREDMVASGVNFLRHPKVQSAPLSQRVTFLEKKGLTQEEIAEALARKDGLHQGPSSSAGGGQASGGTLDDLYGNQPHPQALGPPLPPPPMYHHEEHPPSPWSNPAVLVPTSLAAGLGLGVAAVQAYRNLWPPQAPEHMGMRSPPMAPHPPSPPRPAQGAAEEQAFGQMGGREDEEGFYSGPPPDPMTELARAIERQASALSELAAASEKSRQDLHSFFSTHVASQTHEIRAELGTIKQMLLLNGTYPSASSATARFAGEGPRLSLTSGDNGNGEASREEGPADGSGEGGEVQAAAKKAEDEEEEERRRKEGEEREREREERLVRKKAAVRGAVFTMVRQNEGPTLSEAADMLTIYLNNLIKYPTVPRFRKVALINQGYKDRVAHVKGHKDFLSSVGYAAGPSCFEWEWHAAAASDPEVGKENLSVLRWAIDLLASAKNGELTAEATKAKEEEEEEGEGEGAEHKREGPTSTEPAAGDAPSSASPPSTPLQPPLSTATAQADPLPPSSNTTPAAESNNPLPGQLGLVTPPRQPPTNPSTPPPSLAPGGDSTDQAQPTEASTTKAPQYPQSFLEIMEQVKRGETPAGIVSVENRLSIDADALLHAPAPHAATDEGRRPALLAKPWEHNRTD